VAAVAQRAGPAAGAAAPAEQLRPLQLEAADLQLAAAGRMRAATQARAQVVAAALQPLAAEPAQAAARSRAQAAAAALQLSAAELALAAARRPG
jgi:hypothetical protein